MAPEHNIEALQLFLAKLLKEPIEKDSLEDELTAAIPWALRTISELERDFKAVCAVVDSLTLELGIARNLNKEHEKCRKEKGPTKAQKLASFRAKLDESMGTSFEMDGPKRELITEFCRANKMPLPKCGPL